VFEKTVVFCICSYNHIVYVLLSNIKYAMTRISTNWDESTSSIQFAFFYPSKFIAHDKARRHR